MIVYIDSDGVPHWIENYACIGSAYTIARAILCQNDWLAPQMSLMDCALRLAWAKRAAEKDPYVGGPTQMCALLPHKGLQVFTDNGRKDIDDKVSSLIAPEPLEFDPSYLGKAE
jgi:20S proteasome alpha/beta subunit